MYKSDCNFILNTLNYFSKVGKNLYLKLNVKKKVLVAGRTKEDCNIMIGGNKVEQVEISIPMTQQRLHQKIVQVT